MNGSILVKKFNARVWAAVLQQHVVPSPPRARCHNKIARQIVPVARLTNHVSMLRLYDAHCRRGSERFGIGHVVESRSGRGCRSRRGSDPCSVALHHRRGRSASRRSKRRRSVISGSTKALTLRAQVRANSAALSHRGDAEILGLGTRASSEPLIACTTGEETVPCPTSR
jgi:hypothetical protein